MRLPVSGDAGPGYTIGASTNPADRKAVFTSNTLAMAFHWTDDGAGNPATFYRALVNP